MFYNTCIDICGDCLAIVHAPMHFSAILHLDVIKVINLLSKDNSPPLSSLAIVKRLLRPRVTHVG